MLALCLHFRNPDTKMMGDEANKDHSFGLGLEGEESIDFARTNN